MAPSLRIPISAKLDEFEKGMSDAGKVTEKATRKIAQDFIVANKEILASSALTARGVSSEWLKAGAQMAGPMLVNAALIVAAFKAVSGAVAILKEDMEEMGDIAEKSIKAGVSPEFWQTFMAGARGAKVSVDDLEDALLHAARASRDVLNPDWTVWDVGLKKVTDVEKKMVEMRELFTPGQSFTGVQMFRDAPDTEGRVRAVLTYMKELEDIGARLAALDLSEAFFGSKQTDNLRQGKQTITEFADSIQKTASDSHAGALVLRTKEVNDELERAYGQLERAIRPSLDGIAGKVNEIKSAWASVVSLLAQAYEIWSRLPGIGALGTVGGTSGPGLPKKEMGAPSFDEAGFLVGAGGNIPLPRRRPSNAPKAVEAAEVAETTDAFDQQTVAIQKNIATLQADAAAVGKTAAEHTQFRAELRLLEAARESDVEITDEQIKKYAEARRTMDATSALQAANITLTDEQAKAFIRLSDGILVAANSAEKAKTSFAAVNDAARFAGNQLIDVIDKATQKGATFGAIMADVMRSVSREMLRAAITGEGALAKLLGTASGVPGGTGGIFGLLTKSLGSGVGNPAVPGATNITGIAGSTPVPTFMAEGGTIQPGGLAYVGEHGPNPRLIRAGSEPIMVTPNDVVGGGGGGVRIGGSTTSINIEGSADRNTLLAMRAMLDQRDKRFLADVAGATRELRRRSVRT